MHWRQRGGTREQGWEKGNSLVASYSFISMKRNIPSVTTSDALSPLYLTNHTYQLNVCLKGLWSFLGGYWQKYHLIWWRTDPLCTSVLHWIWIKVRPTATWFISKQSAGNYINLPLQPGHHRPLINPPLFPRFPPALSPVERERERAGYVKRGRQKKGGDGETGVSSVSWLRSPSQ